MGQEGMKLLHIDIETSPNVAHVWGLFKNNVSLKQLMESSYTMCWAAKWHKSKEVMYDSVYQSEPWAMLSRVWELLDDADAIVHYNGTKFDIPTLNKEFLLCGFPPPSPYKQVDLLKTCRKDFRFPSNKLDYVAQRLGLGGKTDHKGHELWVECMANSPAAWKTMERYNKQDVKLLEKLYLKLLPWIQGHPNWGLYVDSERPVCTNCGSKKVQSRGVQHCKTRSYRRFQCSSCNTWMRGTLTSTPREKARIMMTN